MSPGARSKFGAPCWNLSSFGSKFTLLKKVLVILLGLSGAPAAIWRPGNCAPLSLPRYASACDATAGVLKCRGKIRWIYCMSNKNSWLRCCWGWWVALLVSAHTLYFCHINMLLFKCCQPFVANCTPFFLVSGHFHKSVERDPVFT